MIKRCKGVRVCLQKFSYCTLYQIYIHALFLISGDLFSCHAIDNPSVESELALLRAYGPDVPEAMMRRLVGAFGELRDLADQGLIQYPYSTREVVNIIKHLQVGCIFGEEFLA